MPKGPQKLDQVVEGAIAEFQDAGGFAAAHMDRIANRAGVSKRTLYNYFPSKEALFEEIILRASSVFQAQDGVGFDPAGDPQTELYEMAIRQIAPYQDIGLIQMARLVLGEWMRNPDLVAGIVGQLNRTNETRQFFKDAVVAGALSEEAAQRAIDDVNAFIKGKCLWPSVLSGKPVSKSEADLIASTVSDMFAARFR
ncbi:TetR/AcrR family transcriptional regulator [Halocynthiibacter styelae]|uniref:TetR/AcrR family transcriptional regulator n=1 Tax=Halocynthiibacter styelae TaxID=2761955 RepID=A0A8J7IJV6_9RHOB|nr:TetR/AcrR family transcriptional regulator [Paenihalocynthiibacter styelae]MBI1494513.1 TetR/AcrR family transcriptional regulator [Paenihalocynthiibacter styelae]